MKTKTKKKTCWQVRCLQENTRMKNIIIFWLLYFDYFQILKRQTQADPADVVRAGVFSIFLVIPTIHIRDAIFRCTSISSIYPNVSYTKSLADLRDHSVKLANLWSLWVCFLKSYCPQICNFDHHKKHRCMYWIKCNQICQQSLLRQSYMKHVLAVSVLFSVYNESSIKRLSIIFGRSVSQSLKL